MLPSPEKGKYVVIDGVVLVELVLFLSLVGDGTHRCMHVRRQLLYLVEIRNNKGTRVSDGCSTRKGGLFFLSTFSLVFVFLFSFSNVLSTYDADHRCVVLRLAVSLLRQLLGGRSRAHRGRGRAAVPQGQVRGKDAALIRIPYGYHTYEHRSSSTLLRVSFDVKSIESLQQSSLIIYVFCWMRICWHRAEYGVKRRVAAGMEEPLNILVTVAACCSAR